MAIDIAAAFKVDPPELDFIWPGFVAGTVGALVAPGATGKSFWALEAVMGVACGVAGGDLVGINPRHTGKVVYFAGEDPPPALIGRVHAIGKHLNLDARAAIAENLTLEPVMGRRLDVMNEQHQAHIVKFCADVRLIVFDTLSRVHVLDENSNGDMARLVSTLEYISAQTGASVLYLHHTSKGSAREGQGDQQQAARGASALIDNARWAGFVSRMSPDEAKRLSERVDKAPIGDERRGYFVRFGVSKQNYGAAQVDRWYERKEGGVLVPAHLQAAKGNGDDKKGYGRRSDDV